MVMVMVMIVVDGIALHAKDANSMERVLNI